MRKRRTMMRMRPWHWPPVLSNMEKCHHPPALNILQHLKEPLLKLEGKCANGVEVQPTPERATGIAHITKRTRQWIKTDFILAHWWNIGKQLLQRNIAWREIEWRNEFSNQTFSYLILTFLCAHYLVFPLFEEISLAYDHFCNKCNKMYNYDKIIFRPNIFKQFYRLFHFYAKGISQVPILPFSVV